VLALARFGVHTTYAHDEAGRQVRVHDAEDNLTTSIYDPAS